MPSFRQEFAIVLFLWIVLSKLFVLACNDNGMPYKAKTVILQCCHSQCKDSECVVSL